MRKWLGMGLLALLVLVAVGVPPLLARTSGEPAVGRWPSLASLIWRSERRAPLGPTEPPVPQVSAGETVIPTVRGSYCWGSGDLVQCADAIDPPTLIAQFGTATPVVPGARVKVQFPGALLAGSLGVTHFPVAGQPEPVTLDAEGSFQAPTQVGRYIYAAHGRWPQGDASYVFAVEVYDSKLQAPPIRVLIGGKPVSTVRGGACWSSGGQALCTDMLSPAEQLAGRIAPVRKPGDLVAITFPVAPDAMTVYLVTSGGREPVNRVRDGSIRLPEQPGGPYVYEVEARWPQGSGTYGFAVEVK